MADSVCNTPLRREGGSILMFLIPHHVGKKLVGHGDIVTVTLAR